MARLKSKISDEVSGQFTSMIDMVFLLVIFFIVQPFKAPEMRMRAELPKQVDAPPDPNAQPPVKVRIMSLGGTRGEWSVDGRTVNNFRNLPGTIREAALNDPNVAVQLIPDTNVKFDYVLKALDACGTARMPKVSFSKPVLGEF